jgi:hypothetical protein
MHAISRGINFPLARLIKAAARQYWAMTLLLLAIPFVALQIWPNLQLSLRMLFHF